MAPPVLRASTRPRSLADFLDWEDAQAMKHEFRAGQIRMMTGGTLRHNRIADNIVAALNARFAGGPCRAYGHNARVAAWEADAGYYPDVVVDCGPYDAAALAVAEPNVVFEVLSPSTRGADFAEKVPDYRDTATITQIILIEPDEPKLHVWTKTNAGWRETNRVGADTALTLPALSIALPLSEIYAGA